MSRDFESIPNRSSQVSIPLSRVKTLFCIELCPRGPVVCSAQSSVSANFYSHSHDFDWIDLSHCILFINLWHIVLILNHIEAKTHIRESQIYIDKLPCFKCHFCSKMPENQWRIWYLVHRAELNQQKHQVSQKMAQNFGWGIFNMWNIHLVYRRAICFMQNNDARHKS